MTVARGWLEAEGYEITDTSANKPYAFLAVGGDRTLKVEVKGTTGDRADVILMTHNEVELHLAEVGGTALLIVSRIRLEAAPGGLVATGGDVTAELGWNIDAWARQPLAFRLWRP